MNIKIIILISLTIVLSSCTSIAKEPKANIENAFSDSALIIQTDSIQTSAENPNISQSFESAFSVHDLFKSENSDVVNTMAQEDFELVIKKIKHYWPEVNPTLTESQKANFRYMHIYAFAGLVAQKKKSRAALKNLLDSYKNQNLISQYLEITQGNKMPFNQIQVEQTKKDIIEISLANNDGLNIHCFVHARIKKDYKLEKHIGKRAYLCGKLSEFKLSDKDVYSWIVDMKLSEGFIKILEDEFEKE